MMELIRATRIPQLGVAAAAALRAKATHAAAGRGLLLVADQGVASATNFLTTIMIGRACLPEELGLYSLAFSLSIVLMTVPWFCSVAARMISTQVSTISRARRSPMTS